MTFQANQSCSLLTSVAKDGFPSAYSMKLLHFRNARPNSKIFIPIPRGTTQSLVFPPAYVDEAQATVVKAKVGDGFLAYGGHFSDGEGSDTVILALCGL